MWAMEPKEKKTSKSGTSKEDKGPPRVQLMANLNTLLRRFYSLDFKNMVENFLTWEIMKVRKASVSYWNKLLLLIEGSPISVLIPSSVGFTTFDVDVVFHVFYGKWCGNLVDMNLLPRFIACIFELINLCCSTWFLWCHLLTYRLNSLHIIWECSYWLIFWENVLK